MDILINIILNNAKVPGSCILKTNQQNALEVVGCNC